MRCYPYPADCNKRVLRMELKVGDIYKCHEGHRARIVWISGDKKVMAVRCPKKHLKKVSKGRKIYDKNMVFLIKI